MARSRRPRRRRRRRSRRRRRRPPRRRRGSELAGRERLRRSDSGEPGIERHKHGRGFTYRHADGTRVDDAEVLARIHELVIPPAWQQVWICPYPGGHIQATGVDQRGRKQYLYHPHWRERRDQEKFDAMVRFARALPDLRAVVDADIVRPGMGRERVLACATRLLDRGMFRIGSEDYAVQNESYGLATILKAHVTLRDRDLVFDYPAKSGKRRIQSIVDPEVAEVVGTLKRRRGGGPELLAYKDGRRWRDVRSTDINEYLKAAVEVDVSAKDFRTWGATVLAATTLAVVEEEGMSKAKRKRVITYAVNEVARYLGNTPAVARASYIDPRVFDRYRDGETIAHALTLSDDSEGTAIQGVPEEAVLELLADSY